MPRDYFVAMRRECLRQKIFLGPHLPLATRQLPPSGCLSRTCFMASYCRIGPRARPCPPILVSNGTARCYSLLRAASVCSCALYSPCLGRAIGRCCETWRRPVPP